MANAQEKIESLLAQMSGGSDLDRLKMLLYYGDLSGEFEDDDDWAQICQFAVEADEELGGSEPYLDRYAELVQSQKFPEAMQAMVYDLRDNKIFAAMAIHRAGLPKAAPLVSAAAYNKHAYQGLKDEFAVTRFLVWSGFDINEPNPSTGMTALHKFASTQVAPGSYPRAVKWLLEHGADVDAANANGDTALAYLCATVGWGEAQDQTYGLLLDAGSNPFAQSKDGATPYSLLEQLNAQEPSELRAARIEELKEFIRQAEREDEESGDEADGESTELSPSENLARTLLQIKGELDEIRGFYVNEPEDGDDSGFDRSNGEQYLKRLYQLTLGFAIRNNLFGRPEFYSPEVVDIFKNDLRFAYLFDPSHVMPAMDSFHKEFAAKVFLGFIPSPGQEGLAQDVLKEWTLSPGLRELVAGNEDEPVDMNALLAEGSLWELEKSCFGRVARLAATTQLSLFVQSGWCDPFLGIPRKGAEIPDVLSTRVAIHILNRRKVRDGVEGRALGFALLSFAMQLSQGLFSGPGMPEDAFSDVDADVCCVALGDKCRLIAVEWGLSEEPYPAGEDVVLEKIEMSSGLKGLMEALQGQEEEQGKPGEGQDQQGRNDGDGPTEPTPPPPPASQPGTTVGTPGEEEIPIELLEAAKAYRAKGGHLGAIGRWAFKDDPDNPNKHVEFDMKWARAKMGKPEGDKIIAEARAKAAKDKGG
ncbi:ankyrin repeat domain-containing protein [Acidovorax soli]|uniref:Ankyrin repeat-containing protein n=1 Tax=Acidovorax soli TaxID=592050 RepID=A0A1H4BVF3_9BURK|nr:ankyrin repeat domain-containing protein [Acidovorax soli]SEA52074.1 Ankyrin repeat-containing protein [Acidovorax soli]